MILINILARLSLIPLIIGVLFKIMHWPGASLNLFLAAIALLIFHSLKFLKTERKLTSDYLLIGTVALFGLGSLFQVFSKVLIPQFPLICTFSLLTFFIIKYQVEKASIQQHIIAKLFFWPALVLIILCCIFKIMHWPGASIMLLLGSMFALVWVIASLLNFVPRHK